MEVWTQRTVFDVGVMNDIEKRFSGMSTRPQQSSHGGLHIAEADKARGGGVKKTLGGSLFGSGTGAAVPPLLQPLVTLQTNVSKVEMNTSTLIDTANSAYNEVATPDFVPPSNPVYAHKLAVILKNLTAASNSVNESLSAQRALLAALEKLVEESKQKIKSTEAKKADLESKRSTTQRKKDEVEDMIMRGLSADNLSPLRTQSSFNDEHDDQRPEPEPLTPPPVESLTPTDEPPAFNFGTPGLLESQNASVTPATTTPVPSSLPGLSNLTNTSTPPIAGADLLSSLVSKSDANISLSNTDPRKRPRDEEDSPKSSNGNAFKRRSLSAPNKDAELAAFANDSGVVDVYDELDPEVKGMLEGTS
jgi:hypothetical protein